VADSWERIRLQILKLSLEQMNDLHAWLGEAIAQERSSVSAQQQAEAESLEIPVLSGREVVESRQIGKVTYRWEGVKCGKSACRCATGQLHGPYWYAYQRQNGRVKSWYVGKTLSTGADDDET
jgi:hypothetical protein